MKGRWSQKFFSKVIKTDINDDIMTIHARFEEIHDQVCKQFQVGELTLLSVFNKTIMQPDYFVAYIKDVQKPDMKCNLKIFSEMHSYKVLYKFL